jgi:hypothetical protein
MGTRPGTLGEIMKVSRPLVIAGVVLGIVVQVASIVLIALIWNYTTVCYLRRALPASATEIRDEALDVFPDSAYFLKARMPQEDFEAYCMAIRLSPHYPGRVYTDQDHWLSWSSVHKLEWWDPSDNLDGTYVLQEGREWTMAKYENGKVYVTSFSH